MSADSEDRFAPMRREPKGPPLPRRFYKTAAVAGDGAPYAVTLDGRAVKTPLRRLLAVPYRALAEAMAVEWQRQDEVIDPAKMPLTRLANTVLDRVKGDEARIAAEIIQYAGSDLVCYRAEAPVGLIAREAAHWDPILTWAGIKLSHPFIAVSGLIHQPQPAPTLQAVADHLAARDAFALAAVHNLASLTGSALLAIAIEAGKLAPDAAWAAAHVDEDWQIEHWGADDEAQRRRQARRVEFDAAVEFMGLARG